MEPPYGNGDFTPLSHAAHGDATTPSHLPSPFGADIAGERHAAHATFQGDRTDDW
ncbi:hypothetical protein DA2_0335 [Desulfovibrio sp. A2]|nr:hypothetical protein DA2_0335 [Desulfovibrio sp. A2]